VPTKARLVILSGQELGPTHALFGPPLRSWEKLFDLHERPMINVASGAIFYVYDQASAISRKPLGWLELGTMGDEINRILFRAESKFCTPNGAMCTGKTIGLLVRRHIVAGEFHHIGKEASTRWGSGPDLSMMAEAGWLDPVDKTFREYERIVDPKYLHEIRAAAKQFSTKLLSCASTVAECAIRNLKNGQNTIRSRTLRKLIRAIHDLQNIRLRRHPTSQETLKHPRRFRHLGGRRRPPGW